MTIKNAIARMTQQEQLNFLLTNRIPRRWSTLFMGWFSRIELPPVRWASIALWKLFADDLNLAEARKSRFRSMHDCFIRELKDGARPIDDDPDVIISPCDAIVGAHGRIEGNELFQAKGFPYRLEDLLPDRERVERYRDGQFLTLRLKSDMYHHFHAPCDCRVQRVDYISGDTWNVNPIALKRIERLYCKNERAVIDLQLDTPGEQLTLVPVAAILVASIRLNFIQPTLDLRYRGPNRLNCDARFRRGQEMGYFQHGSTIIVFASANFRCANRVREGQRISMGQPLLRRT